MARENKLEGSNGAARFSIGQFMGLICKLTQSCTYFSTLPSNLSA